MPTEACVPRVHNYNGNMVMVDEYYFPDHMQDVFLYLRLYLFWLWWRVHVRVLLVLIRFFKFVKRTQITEIR